MSFYYDDDDDESHTSTACPNCGSTDNYQDAITGSLICSSCYTQSQAHTQEELDIDEVQALAARNQSGRIMGIRRRYNKRGFAKVKLEDLDTSTPFPSLDSCIEAYMLVLQVSASVLCDLLELNEKTTVSVHANVKNIWFSYLNTWKEGADFYGALHPEVRFCMRDAFIRLPGQRGQIWRYLSYEAVKKLKQQLERGIDSELAPSNDTTINTGVPITITEVMDLYKRRGRLEAALRTKPSMLQAASILLLVTTQLGIAAHHIITWIADGKLPLINAFQNCLTKELQEKVSPIISFFRLEGVPSIHMLEYHAKLLFVTSRTTTNDSPPSLLTQSSIPLLTTRLVMDLGFHQQVLDNALALMGRYRGPPRYWLPEPLVRLDIQDTRDIVAVLVVAVKMCPDWQTWRYYRCSPEMPWNDAMAQQFRNGHLNPFLDFLDTNSKKGPSESCLPAFTDQLKVGVDKGQTDSFPVLVAGFPNPNQPQDMEVRQKHHDFNLRLRKRRAVWADANGIGEYIIYEQGDVTDLSNLHPHYLLLLEHVSLTCCLSLVEIHTTVLALEKEVCKLGRDVMPKVKRLSQHWKKTMTPQQFKERLQADATANPQKSKHKTRQKHDKVVRVAKKGDSKRKLKNAENDKKIKKSSVRKPVVATKKIMKRKKRQAVLSVMLDRDDILVSANDGQNAIEDNQSNEIRIVEGRSI